MADIFVDGDQGSRSVFVAALAALQAQGQSVLEGLAQTNLDTLLRIQQDLNALNGRRQRAYRLPVQDIAGQFLVSDLLDVDQPATSATVRADSSSVTLRERSSPGEPAVQSTQFSTSDGSIEQFSGMHRVTTTDGSAPTGTFSIQFYSGANLTLIIFDMVMSPSSPTINVQVSATGVTYSAATKIACNGSRVSAWLPEGEVKYVQISITPSHPDTLGGSAYTFGLTDFTAYMVDYQMQSEFQTQYIDVTPGSSQLQLVADDSDGLVYSLSLGAGAPYTGVAPGQVLNVPGAVDVEAGLVSVSGVTAAIASGTPTAAALTEVVSGNAASIVAGSYVAFDDVSGAFHVTGRNGLTLTLDRAAPVGATLPVTLVSAFLDPSGNGMLWWLDETGTLVNVLPANLYGDSLSITDASGAPVRRAPGLNPAFASHLTVPVFALYQGNLIYRPLSMLTGSPVFSVSYTAGPATVPASLLVQLTTRDRAVTPVFQGASLQNVY